MSVETSADVPDVHMLRARLGAALQKHRLLRGLTQAELAEYANLSLKYVGEIERGDANTTLDVLERLAAAVGRNPIETVEGMREPLSEGVRRLLLDEVQLILERLRNMTRWLQARPSAERAIAWSRELFQVADRRPSLKKVWETISEARALRLRECRGRADVSSRRRKLSPPTG
jgi:transcriptional regulator with XRE-family HTH domain